MSERTGLGKASLLSYLVIEKFVDLIFFVILFFMIALTSRGSVTDILLTATAAMMFVGLNLFIYLKFNGLIMRIAGAVIPEGLFGRVESLNSELLGGLYLFRSVRQVLRSAGLFLAAWSCIVVIFFLVSWPFLAPLQLPLYAPFVLMVFSALSLAIPSAPSAVGTMHFAFLIAIRLMTGGQYDVDLAAGFIVVLHFFVNFFDFVLGAVLLGAYKLGVYSSEEKTLS